MTRSVTSLRTIAATTASAAHGSPASKQMVTPTSVPTTRLPSCIGNHSTGYHHSGPWLRARKTVTSVAGMGSRRAPTIDNVRSNAAAPMVTNQGTLEVAPITGRSLAPGGAGCGHGGARRRRVQ